tara:strand:+ start:1368 stop:1619 length:252 start_codon:yes stop_codon:yes gene_type:complete
MTWLMAKIYGGAAAILAVVAAVFALRHSGIKQGRQDVNDELTEAYNHTTKEVRHAQSDLSSDPVAVLDSLREFAERGKRGGDT